MTVEAVRQPTATARWRRMAEGTGFVAVWIALGYLLPVDGNGYLLLGIPLALVFQLLVRRRPLRELWIRDPAERFRLDRAGVVLAVLLALAPIATIVEAVGAGSWTTTLWGVAAVAGAAPAAWVFRRTRFVRTVLYTLPTVAVGVVVLTILGLLRPVVTGGPVDPTAALVIGVFSVLQYIPALFVLEEVAFRGVLDAHVQHPGERGGIATAVVFSAVWGAWHLPISSVPGAPLWLNLVGVVWVSVLLGIPLAYAWRRTGSLAAPVLGHALYDGIRNAVLH